MWPRSWRRHEAESSARPCGPTSASRTATARLCRARGSRGSGVRPRGSGDGPLRAALLGPRGCREGVRGFPRPESFCATKTHLAPPKPRKRGDPLRAPPESALSGSDPDPASQPSRVVTRPPRKVSAKAARVAEKPSLRDTSFAQIVQSIERGGIERWHAREEVAGAMVPASGAGTG